MYHPWILWLVVCVFSTSTLQLVKCFHLTTSKMFPLSNPLTSFAAYSHTTPSHQIQQKPSPPSSSPQSPVGRCITLPLSESLTPTKTNIFNGKFSIWRCISCWKWGFSNNVMSVNSGITNHHQETTTTILFRALGIPNSIFCHGGVCAKDTSNLRTNCGGKTPSSRKTPQRSVGQRTRSFLWLVTHQPPPRLTRPY